MEESGEIVHVRDAGAIAIAFQPYVELPETTELHIAA